MVDIRNYGFMAGVEVAALPDLPTKRALDIFDRCFQKGVMVCASPSPCLALL